MLAKILRNLLILLISPLMIFNGAILRRKLPHPSWCYAFLIFFLFSNIFQWQVNFLLDNPWHQFNQILKLAHEKKVEVDGTPYDALINKYAQANQLDPCLVAAVIQQESGFRPSVVSHTDAKGLMQIIPGTWNFLVKKGYLEESHQKAFDPETNVKAGTKYLKLLSDRYQGNLVLALASYNAGPGTVDKYKGVPPFIETRNYIKKIIGYWSIYRGDIPREKIVPHPSLVKIQESILFFNLTLWALLFFWLYRTYSLFSRY